MQTADRRCTTAQEHCSGNGERDRRESTNGTGRAAKGGARTVGTIVGCDGLIAAIGRMLVTLGLLILLFVSYELWGTGIFTARAQASLKHQFKKELAQARRDNPVLTVPTTGLDQTTTTPRAARRRTTPTVNPKYQVAPPAGQAIGLIDIDKIGVHWIFVEGVQLDDLRQGPRPLSRHPAARSDSATPRSPGTARPTARRSSASTSSHRATRSRSRRWRARSSTPSTRSRSSCSRRPSTSSANTPDAELTLTSCNPQYSASQRIVIKARLVAKREHRSPTKPPHSSTGRRSNRRAPAELATSLAGRVEQRAAFRAVGFHRRVRRPAVVVGVPAVAPPVHVAHRRGPVPGRCCSRSTCTSNERSRTATESLRPGRVRNP